MKVTFKAKVWLYTAGQGAWHFITVPMKQSSVLRKKFGTNARGWGSLPVEVKIGQTSWRTSIFPESKSGAYLLPVKASIRKKEEILEGDTVAVSLIVH